MQDKLHKKDDMKNDVILDIPIKFYNSPKKPNIPQSEAQHTILPLKILALQSISHQRSKEIDYIFFREITMPQSSPEFGGFGTCLACEQGQSQMPGTKAVYTPPTDMTPSDPTTML